MGRILFAVLLFVSAFNVCADDQLRFNAWLLQKPTGWSHWLDKRELVLSAADGQATIRIGNGEDYQGSLADWLLRKPGRVYGDRAQVVLRPQRSLQNKEGYPILLQPVELRRNKGNVEFITIGAANPQGRAHFAVFSASNEQAFVAYSEQFNEFWRHQAFSEESRVQSLLLPVTANTEQNKQPTRSDSSTVVDDAHDSAFASEVLHKRIPAGGRLRLGEYACAELQRDDSLPSPRSFRLSLLSDGGWRKVGPGLDERGRPLETLGKWTYRSSDGRVNMESLGWRLENDERRHKWSRFFTNGRDAAIVAEEKADAGKKTLCEWVSGDKAAVEESTVLEITDDVATTEIRTAPGMGLKERDIERIVYQMTGTTGAQHYYIAPRAYLLLKDGWLYSALQCPPADLNVPVSRRLEREHWHRWKSVRGKGYYVQWFDRPGHWEKLEGAPVSPMHRSPRLQGTYTASQAYYSDDPSGVMARSIHFGNDGRFITSGTGTRMPVLDPGAKKGSNPVGTEAVAVSYRSAPNAGSYHLDGYTLELRYDDGHIERLPAFFLDVQRRKLNVDGLALRVVGNESPANFVAAVNAASGGRKGKTTAFQRQDPLAVMRNEPLPRSPRQ